MSNNKNTDISSKVFGGLFWRFAERVGAYSVSFIVSIILARILDPEVHGTIALVTVFTAIFEVFVDSGLGSALIQKKDADDLDFSSVFFFNVAVCCILYIIMFIIAPIIASFYEDNTLTPIIRVLSITLIISGVKNIQHAYIARSLQFRRFFFATLGGTITAAIIGVYMAYQGYGVWALVAQYVINNAIDTIILWITVKWRPKMLFSWKRLKGLLSYGWKLLVSTLIDTAYSNLRQLIIGKKYTSEDLAYYNRGRQFPSLIVENINASINSVLFPTMSQAQDNRVRLKEMTRRAIKTSTYIMAPMMMGMAFCAEPIVRLLLTEKWIECVPYMRIFCITLLFYPIHTANLNAIKAMGRSDIFLKLENMKKIVGLVLLLSTMWFGVMVMAYSLLLSAFIAMVINSWPNRKLLDYKYENQMKDIMPGVVLAIVMGICVYPIKYIGLNDLFTLLIQIPLGAIIYIGVSKVLKFEAYQYIIDILKYKIPWKKTVKPVK